MGTHDVVEEIQSEFYEDVPRNNSNDFVTQEEMEFWDNDSQGKEGWVAEARRYKVPICTESLRLSCPAPECIEKKIDMVPAYLKCKSKQGGNYIAMMFVCNYCNAMTATKEEAQRNNIFAGHIVSRFAQNYIRRAIACGISDISTIPLPSGAVTTVEEQQTGNILNKASTQLPNTDVIEEMRIKLDEIHQIVIGFQTREEEVIKIMDRDRDFEKVEEKELEEVVEEEEEEEISSSQKF